MVYIKENIREINDRFRVTGNPELGKVVFSSAVISEDITIVRQVMRELRTYDDFTKENDPYNEHDYGRFEIGDETFLWKIDYYDLNYHYGSEDKTDLNKTRRVLTVMKSYEY